jgi:hypothetical protein
MLFLKAGRAFFMHGAPRYLRRPAGTDRLPRNGRSDKIVFLQQSGRKFSSGFIRQASPTHSFIYMKSFIKQLKKDEIVIGSAIVVFTFIVEFTRYVIHH